MITTDIEKNLPETLPKRGYGLLVVKFICSWLLSILWLVVIAFLLNLDWARPQIESAMSESFHRDVKLGRLSWNFGLNGLAIATDRMSVTEPGGKPFLITGPSEIGVAFVPLVKGDVEIRHLLFHKPEFWAVHLQKDRWNFSDLIQPGPEIRFIELQKGRIHIVDAVKTGSDTLPGAPYDFEDINLKLIFPRKDRRWPFYLSFSLPRNGYTTSVRITALGVGLLDRWQKNQCEFSVDTKNLKLSDLGPYSKHLPTMGGLFNFRVSGQGVLEKGLHGEIEASARQLDVNSPELGRLAASQASGTTHFSIDPQKLEWTRLALDLGNLQIHSQGTLSNWQSGKDYTAKVTGQVADLSQLHKLLPAAGAANLNDPAVPVFLQMLQAGNFAGNAQFEVAMESKDGKAQYAADLKSDGVAAKALASRLPCTWLAALAAEPTAIVKGNFKIKPSEDVEFPGLDFVCGDSVIHICGSASKDATTCNAKFTGKALNLKELGKRIIANGQLAGQLTRTFAVNSAANLQLSGLLDLSGDFSRQHGAEQLKVLAHLNKAQIAIAGLDFDSRGLNGDITYDGKTMKLAGLSGTMGDGQFQLSGSITTEARPRCDLDFKASHIDLSQLGAALHILKVQLPILSEHQLHGRVRDFSLTIKGPTDNPQIELSAVPEDLYYQPPGLSRALRAVSGFIDYKHDTLTLREVGLLGKDSTLLTSLVIDHLSSDSTLKRMKVRSSGSELSDVHFYLSSSLMPPGLRQGYLDFLKRYQILSFHGKVYGDMTWQAKGASDFLFDGVMGFYNVGGRFGSKGYPLEHASGVVAVSGNELLLQDINASVGRTQFNLEGHVNNYRTVAATGSLNLNTDVYPDELLQLLPGLADQLKGKILSSGPLSVRASVLAKQGSATVIFSGRADEKDNLRLLAPFGTVSQPPGQPITLDGSAKVKPGAEGSVELLDGHLLVGDSSLQAKGKYSWSADPHAQPRIEARISSPNPIAARTIVAMLEPGLNLDAVKGTIHGGLSATGTIDAMTTKGSVAFANLSLPQFNLSQVSGVVETPGWSLPPPNEVEKIALSDSKLHLHLDTLANGQLLAKNIDAQIEFHSRNRESGTPRITLSSGTAEVASGRVNLDGWMDIATHKVHAEGKLNNLDSNETVTQLLGFANEISGSASGHLVLDSEGTEYKDLLHNLDGQGSLTISGGKVTRFGQLQSKLVQATLLQQGLFGFNLNNLLQSMVPVRTGYFKELHASFLISKGDLAVNDLRYNGDDMRLWGAGNVNLSLNTMTIEVAGKVPRVASSLISGPVGQVSRHMTIQNLMNVVTLHKLENLPSFPILGDIASDKPRVFAFSVAAPLDKPRSVAQSIEKSFHWLAPMPNASAHPVPVMELQ